MVFCSTCGSELEEQWVVCPNCGVSLKKENNLKQDFVSQKQKPIIPQQTIIIKQEQSQSQTQKQKQGRRGLGLCICCIVTIIITLMYFFPLIVTWF